MISDCENFSNDSFVALYYIWIPTYFIHWHTVEEQALCPGGGVGDEDSGGVVLQLLGEVLHVVRLGLERHQVRVQLRPLRLAQLLLRVLRTHTFSYPGQRSYFILFVTETILSDYGWYHGTGWNDWQCVPLLHVASTGHK